MKTVSKALVLTLLITLFAGAGFAQEPDSAEPFYLGVWKVDVPRTIEEIKKSPEYDAEKHGEMPEPLKQFMATQEMRITPENMTLVRRGEEQTMPFSVEKSEAKHAILLPAVPKQGEEGQEITVKLDVTLTEDNYLRVLSNASNDMNHYFWVQAKPQTEAADAQTPDPETPAAE